MLASRGRRQEAIVLVRHALEIALEAGQAVRRAARLQQRRRHPRPGGPLRGGGSDPRRRDRLRPPGRQPAMGADAALGQIYAAFALGKWDEALESSTRSPRTTAARRRAARALGDASTRSRRHPRASRGARRGRDVRRARWPSSSRRRMSRSAPPTRAAKSLVLLLGDGQRRRRRWRSPSEGLDMRAVIGTRRRVHEGALRRRARRRLRAERPRAGRARCSRSSRALPPGRSPQASQAQAVAVPRASRRRSAARRTRPSGSSSARPGCFREIAAPFYLAVTQLEHAEWLRRRRGAPTRRSRSSPRRARSSSG